MTDVIFVLETPTPQRTPTLNTLYNDGVDLLALYYSQDTKRGWGTVSPDHPNRWIPSGLLKGTAFLAKHILQGRPQVICCFGYHRISNIAAVLLARIARIQVVTRSDSNWHDEQRHSPLRRRLKRLAIRALYGRRTRVWTIGQQNDLYWANMGIKNRHLIPYGVPVPPIGTQNDREEMRESHGFGTGTVFLSVSVLEPWKGIRDVIDSFRQLRDSEARLVIVGKGSLERLVTDAAIADPRITYLGAVPQYALGKIYAGADVLVLASHREPWGLVINEAQANALYIIASDAVGAARDTVNNTNGRIFPAGSRIELLEALSSANSLIQNQSCRLPPVRGYSAAPEMLEELTRFGVAQSPTPLSAC